MLNEEKTHFEWIMGDYSTLFLFGKIQLKFFHFSAIIFPVSPKKVSVRPIQLTAEERQQLTSTRDYAFQNMSWLCQAVKIWLQHLLSQNIHFHSFTFRICCLGNLNWIFWFKWLEHLLWFCFLPPSQSVSIEFAITIWCSWLRNIMI